MVLALVILTLLINLNGISQAPSKPDFSGVWNARISRPDASAERLNISYQDPKLKILRTRGGWTTQFVYYTDGRGEKQRWLLQTNPDGLTRSKTERVGAKFVTTTSTTLKEEGRKVNTELTVTWEVSPDGKTLTETRTVVSDSHTSNVVHMYDRVDANTGINGEWVQKDVPSIVSLIIEHRDPQIKITRRVVSQAQDKSETSIYYTDGRGETNVKGGHAIKSMTKWDDQRLVFVRSSRDSLASDALVTESIKWQIAKDGETLTETTQVDVTNQWDVVPSNPGKLVYARSSKLFPRIN